MENHIDTAAVPSSKKRKTSPQADEINDESVKRRFIEAPGHTTEVVEAPAVLAADGEAPESAPTSTESTSALKEDDAVQKIFDRRERFKVLQARNVCNASIVNAVNKHI